MAEIPTVVGTGFVESARRALVEHTLGTDCPDSLECVYYVRFGDGREAYAAVCRCGFSTRKYKAPRYKAYLSAFGDAYGDAPVKGYSPQNADDSPFDAVFSVLPNAPPVQMIVVQEMS